MAVLFRGNRAFFQEITIFFVQNVTFQLYNPCVLSIFYFARKIT